MIQIPTPRIGRFRRIAIAVGLLGLVFLLGGCVYLRLLELKNQLAKFEKYFDVDDREGMKLTLKDPVLLDADVRFLKLVPERRDQVGTAERWQFRWLKANAPLTEDPPTTEITAEFIFSNHKLSRVLLPERLFVFFPKPFFIEMLRAVGGAKIDTAKREASVNYSANHLNDQLVLLSETQVTNALGSPSEILPAVDGTAWRYRYEKATPDQKAGNIDITFTFDPDDHRLARLKGRILSGAVDFKFPRTSTVPSEK